MSSAGQSRGNEFVDLIDTQSDLNPNEKESDNELRGVVKIDRFLVNHNVVPRESNQYLPFGGLGPANMPQTGGYQSRSNALIMMQSVSNASGGFHDSGIYSPSTSVVVDTLAESNDTSTKFEADSSTGNDRVKSKVDNIELSIGLGFSFILLLMGISTTNILYTILAGVVAVVAVAHYED